jgi:8-oxo-dGTP pyrophosphatase MutT (NUDIX family)
MRYPGEWVFPGGQYEGDNNLVETAIREFKEELNYGGHVENTRLLRSATQPSHGREYFVEFHAAQLDEYPTFTLYEQGEVIGVQWMAPAKALELIHSDQFTREQLEEFRQRGLGDSKYGIHAVNGRQFPVQNVQTLELIQSMPELVGLYKNG